VFEVRSRASCSGVRASGSTAAEAPVQKRKRILASTEGTSTFKYFKCQPTKHPTPELLL